jgi:septal ring factor EnvC (AmiA/AmiB activator)
MSDETFRVLDIQNEETGQCFWACKSCNSFGRKFDKRLRSVETRVKTIEDSLPDVNNDINTMKEDIKNLKTSTEKLEKEDKGKTNEADLSKAVFTEFRERQSRDNAMSSTI